VVATADENNDMADKKTPGTENPQEQKNKGSKLKRRAPRPLALEQRFVFDGAAATDVVDTLHDSPADSSQADASVSDASAADSNLFQLATSDAQLLLDRDGGLAGERGQAARLCLYLFERDQAVDLLRSG